jgi:hypothetical protein
MWVWVMLENQILINAIDISSYLPWKIYVVPKV